MALNFVAKAAITAGLMAANMALTMTRKIEGPRLDDLKSTGADYGTPLYMLWGMRRVEVPIFHAEDLKEVKRRRKTKGGKYNEYTYFGTWAVALAGHEIESVRRIWFDTHLVFDLTGAGPVTPFDFGSDLMTSLREIRIDRGKGNSFFSFYAGTEDQEPDPRMQAFIEAKHGEGSCPAYRGTPYIMFTDIPLEKVGNRIPQVSVEVVSVSEPNYPYETFPTIVEPPVGLWNFTFSTDFSRFMWANSDGTYEIWDTAARQRMIGGTLPETINLSSRLGMYADGHFLAMSNDDYQLLYFSADGMSASVLLDFTSLGPDHQQEEVRVIADGNGDEYWMTIPYSTNTIFFVGGAEYDMLDLSGVAWKPTGYFSDNSGNIWAVGRSGTETVHFYRVVTLESYGSGFFTVTGLPTNASTGEFVSAVADPVTGNFVFSWDKGSGGRLYSVSSVDGTILDFLAISLDNFNTDKQFANHPSGASTIWLDNSEVSLETLTVLRTIDLDDWVANGDNGLIYDPINHALIGAPPIADEITFRYLDRIGSPGINLGDICGGVADMVDVASYDFSDLDQTVSGWSATRGQASNIVEPLLDAYDSDIRPHDWTIQGVKRAGVSAGATLSRFVGDPRYSVKVRQASELPRSLTIDFADIDADQQPNSARVSRPLDATDARGEQKLDLTTLALNVDEAIQLAGRYYRRDWNERKQPMLSLTAQHLGLEPADVRTLELDGTTITARATRVLIKADETIETEWRYDNASLATLDGSAGAAFDGREPAVIAVPLISKGFALDIPLLNDADDNTAPLLYVAAGPYADGTWPGAIVYQETGGEYSDELASVPSSSPVTWGYVEEVMPYANPNLWDRGTELTVTLQTGELIGCTEAEANTDPTLNLIAIGNLGRWELLQFTTAELVTGKTYTVSGFRRGRRGTEWAAELHEANDQFLLLDTAQDEALGLSEVGTELSFMAITSGRSTGFAPITLSDFEGNSLRPYAPVHLEAVKETNGDWTFTWVRRTRVGGAWTSGTPIPLSEATEEYSLTVGDGVSSDTKTVTSPTYLWTVAEQTTDTSGEVMAGDLVWSVAQVSAAVGDGFLATA